MHFSLKSSMCLSLLLGLGLTISGSAMASRPGGTYVNNTYYSDASKTVVIGTRNYDCGGNLTATGKQSGYASFTGGECDANGGEGPPDDAFRVCPVYYDPYPTVICDG